MTLARRLKTLRLRRQMSQRELAVRAQTNQPLICELEIGKRRTTKATTLQRIAAALGVTIGQLLGEEPLKELWTPHRQTLWNGSCL